MPLWHLASSARPALAVAGAKRPRAKITVAGTSLLDDIGSRSFPQVAARELVTDGPPCHGCAGSGKTFFGRRRGFGQGPTMFTSPRWDLAGRRQPGQSL